MKTKTSPPRLLGELEAGPVLPRPARGRGGAPEEAEGGVVSRRLEGRLGGAVLGEVVQDEDLEGPLAEEGGEGLL